jgi:WD40 repeat protein
LNKHYTPDKLYLLFAPNKLYTKRQRVMAVKTFLISSWFFISNNFHPCFCRNYDVVETLDDHSASITAVRFASHGSKLLSCSADKSVVFRNLFPGPSGDIKSSRYHQEVASRGTLYDLDVDPGNKLVVTAGQEKRLTLYSLATGKPVRSFRPESDAGEPIKV